MRFYSAHLNIATVTPAVILDNVLLMMRSNMLLHTCSSESGELLQDIEM